MDDVAIAVVGAAAAVTVLGKGMRPLAKLAMRGVVTATELTSAGRRGLQDLHAEVKAEREQKTAAAAPEIPAEPASPESAESSASG
jgi:hypothetical protein